jgi:3-oxoacyl-[acyl-carrier protein] reductase
LDLGLKGKRAAIQGASSGIGFAAAKILAEEGAIVSICSSNEKRIQEAARSIPGSYPFAIDLDQPGGGTKFAKMASEAMGGIDILITNSGGPAKGGFSELSMEDWANGYKRLWQSAVESIRESLGGMEKQNFGRILLFT